MASIIVSRTGPSPQSLRDRAHFLGPLAGSLAAPAKSVTARIDSLVGRHRQERTTDPGEVTRAGV